MTFMKSLVDEHYPDADCIRVVLDNLSTHKPAAFYEYFEPEEARRLLDKFEFHTKWGPGMVEGNYGVSCGDGSVGVDIDD